LLFVFFIVALKPTDGKIYSFIAEVNTVL